MAHKDKGDLVRSSGIQTVVAGFLHGSSGNSLGNVFLILIDDGGVGADLTQQGLSHSDRFKLVAVGVDHFHHLVVLSTVHQVGGLDDQILHAVFHSAIHGLLHVVDLFAVTSLHMVDDDLCGECAAHRPIRVCSLQSILDALDVLHAAVVEGGAEGDHQQLVVANVVLIAGIVLGSIAGVTAKVVGVGVLTFHQFLLGVGQGIPCSLGGFALGIGILIALLHIDGIDQVCHVLCCHFVSLLAARFAGSGRRSGAGCSAGSSTAAAGEHAGAQSQSCNSCGQLFGFDLSHCSCPFLLDKLRFEPNKGYRKER